MRILKITVMLLACSVMLFGQIEGEKYLKEGDLDNAMKSFGMAFMSDPSNSENAYQLATTLALMNQVDTAFYFLKSALDNNKHLEPLADFNLYSLTRSERWSEIEDQQLVKYQKRNGILQNPEYAKALLNMIMRDQSLDYYIDLAKEEFAKTGSVPHWFYPLNFLKEEFIVKNNFVEMENLIAKYGWPTYSMVGKLAADAPLLVINHHPDDQVRKDYLSMIKEACQNGEGSCIEYAKIHDRILVNDGKPQLYGMQFQYNEKRELIPFPIQSPELVDQRRKSIGLEPLKDYLKRRINYDFDVAQKKN